MAVVRVLVGSLFITFVLLAAYAQAGGGTAGAAAPLPQATPPPSPPQQQPPEQLDFRLSHPAGWEVEIAAPYEASYSQEDEAGIFVTQFGDVSPATPLDALLAITISQLEREFGNFQEVSRRTGELNGRPMAEAYLEGNVETDEGTADVMGRLLLVAGDQAVFMVLGMVETEDADRWWRSVIASMDTFQPEPSPAPGELRVADVALASEVTDCTVYTERESGAFDQGERMHVLMHLEGATPTGTGADQRLVFTVQELVLRDGDGEVFLETGPIGPIELDAPDGFENVCLWVWVDLETEYPDGEAAAEVVLSDDVGQEVTAVVASFVIGEEDAVTVGQATEGTLAAGETRVYSAELEEGVTYVMEVELGTLGDSVLRVLDAAGQELAHDDDSGRGLGSRLTFTPERTAIHRIQVEGYDTQEGSYTLSVVELDDYFAAALPITPGQPAEGTLAANGVGLYAVELQQGVTYVINVSLGTLGDSTLTLLSAEAEQLAFNDDHAGTLASQVTWTAQNSGPHYILVEGYEGDEGSYTLSVAGVQIP